MHATSSYTRNMFALAGIALFVIWYLVKKPTAQPTQSAPQMATYLCDLCGLTFKVPYTGQDTIPCPTCTPLFQSVEEVFNG